MRHLSEGRLHYDCVKDSVGLHYFMNKWQKWQLSFSSFSSFPPQSKSHYNRSLPFLHLSPLLFSTAPFVYAGVTVCQQAVNTVCKRL